MEYKTRIWISRVGQRKEVADVQKVFSGSKMIHD